MMPLRWIFCGLLGVWATAGVSAAADAAADDSAQVRYVTGTAGAEDIVALPGGRWLIAGGLADESGPGTLHVVDRAAAAAQKLVAPIPAAHDRETFADCPGSYDPARFSAHGLTVAPDASGGATLYVVNQGRGAVEAFTVTPGANDGADEPLLTWIGCVPLPRGAIGNGVAALPGGGIAATLMVAPEFMRPAEPGGPPVDPMARMRAGEATGYAVEWFPTRGWSKVPGSEGSGPNGIEASSDGRWLWVAMWGSGEVVRVPRGDYGEKAVIKLPLLPDNLRFGDDGSLWAAGAADRDAYFACWQKPCRSAYAVAQIDAGEARAVRVIRREANTEFGDATTALAVGNELWLAAYPTDRLAVLPLTP